MRQNSSSSTSSAPLIETTRLGTQSDALSAAQLYMLEALKTHERGLKIAIWSYLRSLISWDQGSIESEWEDVLADVRERALLNAHRFDPQKSAGAWLQIIALNCVRELKRKRQREIPVQDAPATGKEQGEVRAESDIFDHLQEFMTPANESTKFILDDLLPYIPSAYHEALRLHFERGIQGKALATHLQISEGAASVKLHRAKSALVAAYEQYAGRGTQLKEDHHD